MYYWKKQTRTLRISENINFTNDDVMTYVIGALLWKFPRAPLPFNPALNYCQVFKKFISSLEALYPRLNVYVHAEINFVIPVIKH